MDSGTTRWAAGGILTVRCSKRLFASGNMQGVRFATSPFCQCMVTGGGTPPYSPWWWHPPQPP